MVKKSAFVLTASLLLVLMFSFSVSGLSTTLGSNYAPGETIIIRIDGNLVSPIAAESVKLQRKNVEVPFIYDIKQFGGQNYLWMIAPESEKNYTLVFEDVVSQTSKGVEKERFTQNFSVSGDLIDYRVEPGFYSGSSDFQILFTSNFDVPQNAVIELGAPLEIVLQPGETSVNIEVEELPTNVILSLKAGKYEIPVFIFGDETPVREIPQGILRTSPTFISEIVEIRESSVYEINLKNIGNRDLKKVSFKYNETLFSIDPKKFDVIESGGELSFKIDVDEISEFGLRDEIIILAGNESITFPIEIIYERSTEPVVDNETGEILNYCSELSGTLCKSSDICSGEEEKSVEGICCIGTCTAPEEGSNAWIGWLIFGIVILIVAVVGSKYKKVAPENKMKKVLKKPTFKDMP